MVAAPDKPTVKELLSRSPDEIIDYLGGIYENSRWVAEGVVKRPTETIATISELSKEMKCVVEQSAAETKLELLRSHPDLCHRVGKLDELTKESQEEQGRAGLQSLTETELSKFTELNTMYSEKFGFPFILAVRNATKHTVLAALEGRVTNTVEDELVCAITQVHKIAWMRLLACIDTGDASGFLTCHVLDTANGCPGENIDAEVRVCACA